MAWCPKCDGDYPIVTSVTGHPVGVPTVTERYNQSGEYIGYEEGKSFTTDMQTVPRCSRCYSVFECPNATSREEYFCAKKELVIAGWYKRKPSAPKEHSGCWIIATACFSFVIALYIISYTSGNLYLAVFLALAVAIGLGILVWKLIQPDRQEEEMYEAETQSWRSTLEGLRSMEYSDANYERLKQL